MSPYCPRCDVSFEKDLPRCPGCGWDFRAHILPPDLLKSPLDFTPLRELGRFAAQNAGLIWINGLTVQILWVVSVWIIWRGAYIILVMALQGLPRFSLPWLVMLAVFLASILFFPIWATYLFSLLRRYRYHVPVPLFAVFAPRGQSRYSQSMSWAPLCIVSGIALTALLVMPGMVFLFIFVPFLLLMHLDKLNVSRRRRRYILIYTFRRLIGLFILAGLALTICWFLIILIGVLASPLAGTLSAALFIPLQSTFAVLLYESLLGRAYLDAD